MVKKISSCVFISGEGSNLKSIIKSSRDYNFPITIDLVISNKINANGLKYAKKHNIPYKFYSSKNLSRFERKCLIELKRRKIKFLCLAGFMKILSKNFINKFKGKIINIHPSLLPKYKGLNTHKKAIENNDKFAGCSVHFVTAKIDSGKIIMQKKVKIKKNDTVISLAKKVLKKEHLIYPAAIKKIYN